MRQGTHLLALLLSLLLSASTQAESIRLATYNLQNYLHQSIPRRSTKTDESKAAAVTVISQAAPHILALQEIGSTNALLDLRDRLAKRGLLYPYWEHTAGYDTNIFVAILSQYPITARRSHTNAGFFIFDDYYQTGRGFAEVDIELPHRQSITILTAHLKSKLPVSYADQAELRLEEAALLRNIIDQHLLKKPRQPLVVLGDLNDHPKSPPIRRLIGRGKTKLIDVRPTENRHPGDTICWTHFYAAEDVYSRIDYILLSPNLASWHLPDQTGILHHPPASIASDHRLIYTTIRLP